MSEALVKKAQAHFYIMVFVKSVASLLTQIGLLHADKAPIYLVVGWPLFIFILGNYLVKTQVTAPRSEKLLKALPIFYIILAKKILFKLYMFF